MKRSTVLVIALNVYGIAAAALAILGILRAPIIIVPFILTPFTIDLGQKSLADPRYRYLSFAITAILVMQLSFLSILC